MDITIYQHDIVWGDIDANKRKIEEALSDIKVGDMVVLPETFTTGFGDHMAAMAEAVEGPTLQWARRMADRHQVLMVGTWIVKEGTRCLNRMHWVYPDGHYGYYDKAHTFRVSGEYDQIGRGTERVVFEWKGWHIKPAVCYDLRFPKWLRNNDMEYDMLLVCANWPASRREAWRTLLRARAIENLCYVVGCNRGGVDGNGGEYSGDSAVIDYKGNPLCEAAKNSPIITATIDKEKLVRFRQKWPFYLDFD